MEKTSLSLLSRSQSTRPEQILGVLLITAVRESWIVVLVNLHMSIFFGVLLLSSGYAENISIIFLTIHISCTLFATALFFYLLRLSEESLQLNPIRTMNILSIGDAIISLGWGSSMILFLASNQFTNTDTLIALLIAAGVASAALSAKLVRVLVSGRLLVFSPSIIYFLWQQPPFWGLYSGSLILGIAISIGVGYFIHIQLLREAALVVELRETQQKIVQDAEFRERFLKSITHDLRQPIASIGLFVRHLSKNVPARTTEFKAIRSCLNSATDILDSVTHLAWINDKLPQPELVPVALDTVLSSIVAEAKPIIEEKGLVLRYVPSSQYCLSEAQYLQRMIRNLLQNAIQNTQQGDILLGVRNRTSTQQVEVQVIDTGSGIKRSDWEKIFIEYERLDTATDSHSGHLGLGLSIVNTIAASLQAKITLSSQPGKGSCFGILLPRYKPDKQPIQQEKSSADHQDYQNKSLLIVDDDPIYAARIKTVAQGMQIHCDILSEDLNFSSLLHNGLPDYDRYIIDLELSDAVSGLDIIRHADNTQQMLLVSQYLRPEILSAAKQSNIQFKQKPAETDTIRSLLIELFITTH